MAWCVPKRYSAFIRDVDDAGFMLRRCVHSPWAIAGCPGQHNYFGSKPQKANPIQTKLEDTGVLVQMCGLSFDGRKKEQVNWQVVGSLHNCFVQTTNLFFSFRRSFSARSPPHALYVGTPIQAQRLIRAEPGKAFANPMCLDCFSLRGNASTM